MRFEKKFEIHCFLMILLLVSGICTACSGSKSASAGRNPGENTITVYTGIPRMLTVENNDTGKKTSDKDTTAKNNSSSLEWISSDKSVATVEDGLVTGLKEGSAVITAKQNDKILSEWDIAVTTFNNGRQVEFSYELGEEGISKLLEDERSIPDPEFWKQNINTIQDVITYMQLCDFSLTLDFPPLAKMQHTWYAVSPGSYVLYRNEGGYEDCPSLAGYLLANDFEDSGYIVCFGFLFKVINWFYEDGYYYVFSFDNVLMDIKAGNRNASYSVFKTANIDDIMEYIRKQQIDLDSTLTIAMFSAMGHDFQPAYYFSYLHDSTLITHEHSTVALEEAVFRNSTVLYSNPNIDYEFIGIPTDELPPEMPRYDIPAIRYQY